MALAFHRYTTPVCPSCHKEAAIFTGDMIWPKVKNKELANRLFWRCDPCNAHTACREGTNIPIGGLKTSTERKRKSRMFRFSKPHNQKTRPQPPEAMRIKAKLIAKDFIDFRHRTNK